MIESGSSPLSIYINNMSLCLLNLKEICGLKQIIFILDTEILPEAELKLFSALNLSYLRYLPEMIFHLKSLFIERLDVSLSNSIFFISVPFSFLIEKYV